MGVTLHFQSTGTVPGNARPVEMVGISITVGRGAENDLVLPDPTKVLSKRHCAIELQGASVVVVDLSTNGTFLNYGKAPIGTTPRTLNNGDILTLGPYELRVEMGTAETSFDAQGDMPPPDVAPSGVASVLDDLLDGPSAGGGDVIDELLGGSSRPTGPRGVQRPELGEDGLLPPLDPDDLLGTTPDPHAGLGGSQANHNPSANDHVRLSQPTTETIPENWGDDDFLAPSGGGGGSIPPGPPVIPEDLSFGEDGDARSDNPFAEPGDMTQPPRSTEPPPQTAVSTQGGDAAARAFLRSAGAEVIQIGDGELEPTMARLGQVFRIMVGGLREILMARATVKSEFRIDQTMIAAGGNNPLKFSVSPEQAVEALIRPTSTGYLEATQAADEALKDIRAHEVAMVSGMEAALKGVLSQLSPTALEGRIESRGGLSGMLKGKKARYWEVYEKLYSEISDQAENDFQELFAREFAKAYKAQLEKLK